MEAQVDKNKCIGCGLCISMCPSVFEWDESKSKVKDDYKCDDECVCAKEAKEACPVQAIEVK